MLNKVIVIAGVIVVVAGIIINIASTSIVKTPELECASAGQPTSGFVSTSKNCATTIDSFNKQSEAKTAQNNIKRTGVIVAVLGLLLVIGSIVIRSVMKRKRTK